MIEEDCTCKHVKYQEIIYLLNISGFLCIHEYAVNFNLELLECLYFRA